MKWLKGFLVIVVWLGVFFAIKTFARLYTADVSAKKSAHYLDINELDLALFLANTAIVENPQEPNYYRNRAKVATVRLALGYVKPGEDAKEEIYADLKQAYDLNPNNLVTMRNLMPLYFYLAQIDINKAPSKENLDPKYFELAKDYLENVKHRFQTDTGVLVFVGRYEKKLGLVTEFAETIQLVSNLRPDLLEWQADLNGVTDF